MADKDVADRNEGSHYRLSKAISEATEAVPLIGKSLNDFDLAICDIAVDTFGQEGDGCRAKRDVVNTRKPRVR